VIRAEAEARSATEPMRDLSLKDGEKINIKVNLPKGEGRRAPRPASGTGGLQLAPPPGSCVGLLPPPPRASDPSNPSPAASAPVQTAAAAPQKEPPAGAPEFGDFAEAGSGGGGDDADFGDFEAA